MNIRIFLSCAALLAAALARAGAAEKSGAWIILSDNEAKAELAIRSAKDFGVGQIQLSHNIIHDLREIRSEKSGPSYRAWQTSPIRRVSAKSCCGTTASTRSNIIPTSSKPARAAP